MSFLNNVDSFTVNKVYDAMAHHLFDTWIASWDDQYEIDKQLAYNSGDKAIKALFNKHYELAPEDIDYLL
jgi:hypothetical protein